MLQAMHRLEHPLQQLAHVDLGPGLWLTIDAGNHFRPGDIAASQPDVHFHAHSSASSVSSAAAEVIGGRHVKFAQMYAAGTPFTGCIASRNGSRPVSDRRSGSLSDSITAN